MANIFLIFIFKKYRALEHEIIYPDAETLVCLYGMSGVQPALFMDMKNKKRHIIKGVWLNLSPEQRAFLLECAYSLVKCTKQLNI